MMFIVHGRAVLTKTVIQRATHRWAFLCAAGELQSACGLSERTGVEQGMLLELFVREWDKACDWN